MGLGTTVRAKLIIGFGCVAAVTAALHWDLNDGEKSTLKKFVTAPI